MPRPDGARIVWHGGVPHKHPWKDSVINGKHKEVLRDCLLRKFNKRSSW